MIRKIAAWLIPGATVMVTGVFILDAVASLKGVEIDLSFLTVAAALGLALVTTLGSMVIVGIASELDGWRRWVLFAAWGVTFFGSGGLVSVHVAADAFDLRVVDVLSRPELPTGFLRMLAYSTGFFFVSEVAATAIYLGSLWLRSRSLLTDLSGIPQIGAMGTKWTDRDPWAVIDDPEPGLVDAPPDGPRPMTAPMTDENVAYLMRRQQEMAKALAEESKRPTDQFERYLAGDPATAAKIARRAMIGESQALRHLERLEKLGIARRDGDLWTASS